MSSTGARVDCRRTVVAAESLQRLEDMTTIHFTEVTTSTPEQFVAGLTDFGPGRSKLFANSHDDFLRVYDQGPGEPTSPRARAASGSACTTTGPTRTTSSSPLPTGTSWAAAPYTPTRSSGGLTAGTEIDVVIVRDGKKVKGGLLGLVFMFFGKRVLGKAFDGTVRAIEARNAATNRAEV